MPSQILSTTQIFALHPSAGFTYFLLQHILPSLTLNPPRRFHGADAATRYIHGYIPCINVLTLPPHAFDNEYFT